MLVEEFPNFFWLGGGIVQNKSRVQRFHSTPKHPNQPQHTTPPKFNKFRPWKNGWFGKQAFLLSSFEKKHFPFQWYFCCETLGCGNISNTHFFVPLPIFAPKKPCGNWVVTRRRKRLFFITKIPGFSEETLRCREGGWLTLERLENRIPDVRCIWSNYSVTPKGSVFFEGKWDPLFQENPGGWNIIPFGQMYGIFYLDLP